MERPHDNTIDRVTLHMQYDEAMTTADNILAVAEEHFQDLILPVVETVIERYQHYDLRIENIDIDLGRIFPEDVPVRLEDMLSNEIEGFLKDSYSSEEILEDSRYSHEIFNGYPRSIRRNAYDNETLTSASILISASKDENELHKNNFGGQEDNDDKTAYGNDESLNYKLTVSGKDNLFKQNDVETTTHGTSVENLYAVSAIVSDLLAFLEKECVPWNVDYENWEPQSWLDECLDKVMFHPHFARQLYQICRTSASARYRLLAYCTDQILYRIVARWMESGIGEEWCDKMKTMSSDGLAIFISVVLDMDAIDDNRLWNDLVDTEFHRLSHYDRNKLLHVLLECIKTNENPSLCLKRINEESITNNDVLASEMAMSPLVPGDCQLMEKVDSAVDYCETDKNQSLGEKLTDQYDKRIEKTESYYSETCLQGAGGSMGNQSNRYETEIAGVVLVHPFLSNLFAHLGLLDEKGQFLSLDHQVHAVHLLRYVSGKEGRHLSHLMNLEKTICGLSPVFPIPEHYEISEEEVQEVADMYEAVREYWKTASRTSVEGLQVNFIWRYGIICFEDPYWLLRIESSAMDILLDDLPWEISTLVFPWNEEAIWVEWQRDE